MRNIIGLTLWNIATAEVITVNTMRDAQRAGILMEAAIAWRLVPRDKADIEFIACAFMAACEINGEVGETLCRFLPDWSCTDGHRACLAIAHDYGMTYA